jgi:hypothetical protein
MEAVEISIYLIVALTVAGLIIYVLATLDTGGLTQTVRTMLGFSDDDAGTIRATNESLAGDLYKAWQSCTYGTQNLTRTIGFSSETTFEHLFDTYEKLNLCSTMRSETFGCGRGETMNITMSGSPAAIEDARIDGPAIIIASCNPQTRQLDIEVSS